MEDIEEMDDVKGKLKIPDDVLGGDDEYDDELDFDLDHSFTTLNFGLIF